MIDNQGGGWTGGFEAEGIVNAGLELKVRDAVISRMQALVDRESCEGKHMDAQSQPLAGCVSTRVGGGVDARVRFWSCGLVEHA